MQNSLKWPRLLVIIASVCLAGAMFLPIWQIQLAAPQYPEGLLLKIYAKGLAGDVDVINGLNHYIGMHTLHTADFIEFTLLPYIIGFLVVLGFMVTFIHKKPVYYAYIGLFMFVAISSMVDFYRWEYNYGHNLDPNAAIVIPGMAYQPPLLGYKKLLNFGAYSIPDIGGWTFIIAGVLLFLAYLLILQPKWIRGKRSAVALASCMLITLQSCTPGPQAINYGRDACASCKMSIMEKKFACEWVTGKGKIFRFDDVQCLVSFTETHHSKGNAFINDYGGNGDLIITDKLFFVSATVIKAPMGGHVAAFIKNNDAETFSKEQNGKVITWQQVEHEASNTLKEVVNISQGIKDFTKP